MRREEGEKRNTNLTDEKSEREKNVRQRREARKRGEEKDIRRKG